MTTRKTDTVQSADNMKKEKPLQAYKMERFFLKILIFVL